MTSVLHGSEGGFGGVGGVLTGWLANRSIAGKLVLLVAVFVVAASSIGLVAVQRLGMLNEHSNESADGQTRLLEILTAQRYMTQVRADVRDHILVTDAAAMVKFREAIQEDDRQVEAQLSAFARSGLDSFETTKLSAVRLSYAAYVKIRDDKVIAVSERGDKAMAYQALVVEAVPFYKAATQDLGAVATHQIEKGKQSARVGDREYSQALIVVVAALGTGLLLAVGLAFMITRLIVRPVRAVAHMLDAMASGDLTATVKITSKDDIGRMALSAVSAATTMSRTIRDVARGANDLTSAAGRLAAVSDSVASSAGQTATQADAVAASAEDVSASVQNVAAGAEEMDASIREIATSATTAALAGGDAVTAAEETSVKAARLGEVSVEISRVVDLIAGIAAQTGLLALNATIEAARAGETGKGFAVVAGEVKGLAQQTAGATHDVTSRITAMQDETANMVEAIGTISDLIDRLGEAQSSIAGAVEEQSRTTNEMTSNVNAAATGAATIAATIAGVAQAAGTTTSAAAEVQRAAAELSVLADRLNSGVEGFRYDEASLSTVSP